MTSSLTALNDRLAELTLRDQRRLRRRVQGAGGLRDADARQAAVEQIAADVDAAAARLAALRARVPAVTYPPELPVSVQRDEIAAAIRDNQVVIVAGETGSGKTTQLPKICLQLGRGVRGAIGHTQPRRLAARTVAERIAAELGTELGDAVGYKVRFTDRSGDGTLVKIMTDGILLAEIQTDRMLERYDTIIVDEAHERSLNIDFLLGYLTSLLPRRPDLKVVVTSATIDTGRFAGHFAAAGIDAPVVEVSGRTYPVEVRYRPVDDPDRPEADRDQTQAVVDAVEELRAEGPGDVLVFLSGEREIRDTAEALAKAATPAGAALEVLPLYARLSAAEQHRVFAPHDGRRVVLATNVAETSLTVPGIRYVVDPGTARISRYSSRTKVQRLPIEPVSRASADQRKGRCGRVADGICIRLYSEDDFLSRPEFTEPEILRTNLASVILQMTALDLGDVAAFPFVEPPDRRSVADGVALLRELGALDVDGTDPRRRLTPLGRQLAQLPVDPRLARMIVAAGENGCLHEVLVVAAALSIQDPRERPAEARQAADEMHARFVDPTTGGSEHPSDFGAYLALWEHLADRQRELSGSAFRRACRAEFLNYLRVREWQDVHGQLRQVVRSLGLTPNSVPAEAARVHQSLLAGLLSQVGMRDGEKREFLGTRGVRFALWPGSALASRPPRWVMAAELVETSRLWGRVAARVEPEWAERLAGHLVVRSYSEPRWSRRRGGVVATERVTLYGLPLVTGRTVDYGRIDPELSRELFLRHALLDGEWQTQHAFFAANQALREDVEELENRVRRRGIVVDDETLFRFYDARVGPEVVSARHFDAWWKKTRRTSPDLLTLDRATLLDGGAAAVSEADYPDVWRADGRPLPLTYEFDPGSAGDGVTVDVPLPMLPRLSADGADWQVPGLREELATALIRSLPKALRRNFVPAPDMARAALARMSAGRGRFTDALARELAGITGVAVPADAWQLDKVPDHLRMTFRVLDEDGSVLAAGKDPDALNRRLRGRLQAAVSAAVSGVAAGIAREGLRAWTIGTLPATVRQEHAGYPVTMYPALVDRGDSVAVELLDSEPAQRAAMWRGTRRLLALTIPSPRRAVVSGLDNTAKLALSRNPHGGVAPLLDDCTDAALDVLLAEHGGPVWDAAGFGRLRDAVRVRLEATVLDVLGTVRQVLAAGTAVHRRLAQTSGLALLPAVADVKAQLADLLPAGFVTATGAARLPDLLRYLTAAERRLERLPRDPERDRRLTRDVDRVREEYRRWLAALPAAQRDGAAATRVRWMIEELRVSYFAQALGTPYPVSEQRIERAMQELPD